MSISDQPYKQYSFAHHGKVYEILEKIFLKYGIKYYLIGANARDVQLYKKGIKPSRGTADIDFAIMVPDIDSYNMVFDELCVNGFVRAKENYRLYFEKTNTAIDLLPYGAIEQDYTVNFIERNTTLSVLGFTEVGSKSEVVRIKEEEYDLHVSPLEGILILKLISWNEKPDSRIKDLDDISFLLNNGWELFQDEAYENHLDLFVDGDDDFDVIKVAARIIGRKMRGILEQNETLKQTIVSILEKSVKKKEKAENPELKLAINMNKSITAVQTLLGVILLGIHDEN